jgi:AcrR family transcriptional regulator
MSELVERTGVPPATVRYYLVEGLLPAPFKAAANRYLYDERHVELVRLVRLLRERRGLSLETIGRVLPEMLPDLVGKPSGGLFRPEMWEEVLAPGGQRASGPSLRDRLVNIGTDAFSARGYGEVTVDDVCRAADIAKGSFYRQFASKEELFLAVADDVAHRSAGGFVTWAAGRTIAPARAVSALADAMMPYLAVVLDCTSLAAQHRPGYALALRSLTSTLRDAVRPVLALAGEPTESEATAGTIEDLDEAADEVVARAVFEAVRRVVGMDVLPAVPDALPGERA